MCIASSLVPLYRIAEYYGQRAEQIALDIKNEAVLIQVLNIKAVYLTGTGQWAKADETFTRAQEIAERVGDRREAIMSRTTWAVVRHYQGRFTEGLPLNDYARQAASRTGNAQQEAWGIYTKAEHLMRLGRFDESIALFEEAVPHVIGDIRMVSLARIKAGMATCYLRQGWLDKAQQYIAEVYDLVGKSTPSVYSCLELYSAMCDVYLTLSEYADHDAERQKYLDLAQQRFKFVKGYARVYPVGKARALTWQGRLHWLAGKHEQAAQVWRQAITTARTLDTRYEERLAFYELGRHLEGTERRIELECAADIFRQVEAAYDLERTILLLE